MNKELVINGKQQQYEKAFHLKVCYKSVKSRKAPTGTAK